jgi:hypothetical protein
VSSNLLAKRTIREILYSPETIKISLFLQPNSIESGSSPNSFDQTKNPANELQGFGVQPVTSPVREFVTAGIAPFTLGGQTITLNIPNFVHRVKTRDLKRKGR